MNKEIILTLREIGVPASIKGYGYLKCAINLCMEDGSYIHAITKRLYPDIAKQFDTTPSRVERAIRHAIEVAWGRGDLKTLQKIFGFTTNANRGKPTNSEFIATLTEQLNMEKEETHGGRNN